MVIDSIAQDRLHHDELFFPVAYLYRHCLELKLKDLIRVGTAYRFFTKGQVKFALSRHDLLLLWTEVRRFLENEWPTAPRGPLNGVERVVRQFHNADPDGQTLRYEHDRHGKRNRPSGVPEFIRLRTLRRTMEAVFNLLEASKDMLRDQLSGWDGP